ncbi:MAG TPA: hypothetical protein VGN35_02740 [Jatrophihabitantaceae bacterium]|jgi:hypothetical protein|nr:hypothetical protein [Jatrophihabitantaceae bacterium]
MALPRLGSPRRDGIDGVLAVVAVAAVVALSIAANARRRVGRRVPRLRAWSGAGLAEESLAEPVAGS